MQHHEMIGAVQDRAHLASRQDAERVIRAALQTLGERVPEGLAHNLAAQLPHEIGEHLRCSDSYHDDIGGRFGCDEFISRVASRAGAPEREATRLARVVFEVVDEATEGEAMHRIRGALPRDVRPAEHRPAPVLHEHH